jgi:hypothetical protein
MIKLQLKNIIVWRNIMMTIKERIEAQKKKVEQEKARLQDLQSRVKTEERKKDTRRKILIGGVVLSRVRRNVAGWNDDALIKLLNTELTAERDRELFDLPPQAKTPPTTEDLNQDKDEN